jgi:hypothetical protein
MNIDLAQMVAMTASRARVAFGDLIPLLKEYGEGEKDAPTKLAIASAIYEIGLVENSVFEKYPDLRTEFEVRLNKYGRSYY